MSREAAWDRVLDALRRTGLLVGQVPGDLAPAGITADSRTATAGMLFLAIPGSERDGHDFIPDAVSRGAAGVLLERSVACGAPVLQVRDARRASAVVARAWYGDPSAGMVLVGVTGTNGKTTTAGITRHLLNAGGDAGLIGTLGAFDGDGAPVESSAGTLTTPGPIELQATFAAMAARGVHRLVMETSSHSLHQGRLDGVSFGGAIFTNLTRDHLDYHPSMEDYLAAKLRLLDLLQPGAVTAVNADDPAWAVISTRPGVVRFGLGPDADLRAVDLVTTAEGSRFRLAGRFGEREVALPLSGSFNVANALGAAAVALGLGGSLEAVAARLATAPQVPGRMERLAVEPCVVLRDYAHTPDALERVLETLRPLTAGRLIVLFGCGGDRDRGKRPEMGRIVARLADLAWVTSDNPRTEDPERILDDILAGMDGAPVRRLVDRRAAIAGALADAGAGDTLVLAGKGHETYQIVGTTKHPFDEKVIVEELLG